MTIQTEKPLLRGHIHKYAFFASLPAGVALVVTAAPGITTTTCLIFAICVALLFGVSALYHIVQWQAGARAWMRRLDHASIYFLISGTYTPVMTRSLEPEQARTVLTIVWGISFVGIAIELLVARVPKVLLALTYIALGWVAVVYVPSIRATLGNIAMAWLAVGGVTYTVGGLIYAAKKPNLRPGVFGYHELFHLLVALGVACHYVVIAFYL